MHNIKRWKVYGPDMDGKFGSFQGTGGLEAVVMDSSGAATGIINDFFGNDVATVSGGSVTWNPTHVGGYGPLPGNIASPLTSAAQLAQTIGWRGHYIDPTGFYNLGARYYEPVSGRFLSCDPLGYAASTSLYNFCNGDAVNSFDPDGRGAIDPISSGPEAPSGNGYLDPDTPFLNNALNGNFDSNYDTSSGYSGVSNLTDWGVNAQDPNGADDLSSDDTTGSLSSWLKNLVGYVPSPTEGIANYPFANDPNAAYDCVPTSLRTMIATLTGTDPGISEIQNEVAYLNGTPNQNWNTTGVKTGEVPQIEMNALNINGISSTITANYSGVSYGDMPINDTFTETANIMNAGGQPSTVLGTLPDANGNAAYHAITVQYQGGNYIVVNNITGNGGSINVPVSQFQNGQIEGGGTTFTLDPNIPIITATGRTNSSP